MGNAGKVLLIERQQSAGRCINGGLQNQLVGRVTQLRPPLKMYFNRLHEEGQTVKEYAELLRVQARCRQMLGPGAYRFVLHKQADTGRECELLVPGMVQ